MIKHCFLIQEAVQTTEWLDLYYPDYAPFRQSVEKWLVEFKCNRSITEGITCLGHLNSVVMPQSIKKVHKIGIADWKLKLREIAESLKISEYSLSTVSEEHLSMRLLRSKSKSIKTRTCWRFREIFNTFSTQWKWFLRTVRNNVTTDETWIHRCTPELNRQSAERNALGEI